MDNGSRGCTCDAPARTLDKVPRATQDKGRSITGQGKNRRHGAVRFVVPHNRKGASGFLPSPFVLSALQLFILQLCSLSKKDDENKNPLLRLYVSSLKP